jgi:hypothetical protein
MEPINQINVPKTDIRFGGPPIIPTIEPPVTQRAQRSVIPEIDMPIINMPDTTIKYPVIDVPTQEEFDAAVKAEQKKQEEEKQEKTRGLPDTQPVLPQVQVPVQNTQDNRIISDQPPTNTNLGVPVIEVPIVGEVPIPPKEQVILAGTTATASVAAALVGKSLVEWMVNKMKPIVQQLFVRGKKLLSRDLTPYELQIFFAFEKSQSLKKVNKLLKKEQKNQKKEQYKKFHSK